MVSKIFLYNPLITSDCVSLHKWLLPLQKIQDMFHAYLQIYNENVINGPYMTQKSYLSHLSCHVKLVQHLNNYNNFHQIKKSINLELNAKFSFKIINYFKGIIKYNWKRNAWTNTYFVKCWAIQDKKVDTNRVSSQCLLRAAKCRVLLHHCTVQLSARHTQMWITVRKKEYSTPTKNWAGLLCNQNLKASRKSCSCT